MYTKEEVEKAACETNGKADDGHYEEKNMNVETRWENDDGGITDTFCFSR